MSEDENNELLLKKISLIGEKVGLNLSGDSIHYKKRTNNI
jgi:hypothetical protein